ncbi:hypothetical protein MIC448_270010 [Microbacterium sp. C448]|uniref:hypothetical protein n=1 Tax=Microbacterium sp. C448 TaxID=1177594 RepID=UPI0003DE2D78|nr:hypothetical protein [Microbacterium sp. C448]CDK00599.1 hypothetical protein MIC448_270010 [Microbacterium sp. C448]
MSGESFVMEYPERNTYGEVMKGYFSLMRGFGIEFANRSDRMLVPDLGTRWFADYVQRRNAEDPVRVRLRQSPEDPSFFLGEYLRAPETVYRTVIPNTGDLRVVSKKIVDTRNTWLHFSDEPSVSQLRDAADLVRLFGVKTSMGVEAPAARMIKRIDRIRTGQYPPQGSERPAETTPPAPFPVSGVDDEPPIEIPLERIERASRPPIGAIWRGDVPDRRVRVTRTRDVVDVATGRSLRGEVDGPLVEKLRQWTSARPMGDLWVDDDGAVGGYIEGRERLLGYAGPDPESDIARGFLVRRYYDVMGGRLVDLDSGDPLADTVGPNGTDEARGIEDAVVAVAEPGGTIRVTNYGDVLYIDEQGMARVAVATPKTWFPGHLG